MLKRAKNLYKYTCLQVLCNTVHRKNKWIDGCKKNMLTSSNKICKFLYTVTEIKMGDGPCKKYEEYRDTGDTTSVI